jgi:putative SOS response-associated peptidase YedK
VVTERDGKRDFVRTRWGLVPWWWAKPLKQLRAATFNARAETVETKPFFRDAFKRSRSLIPASGYYEWQNTPGGKQPYYFTRADGEPMTARIQRIPIRTCGRCRRADRAARMCSWVVWS